MGRRKHKCSPTLDFQLVGIAGGRGSEVTLVAFEAVKDVLTESTFSSTRSGELIFLTKTLLVTNLIVVSLGVVNVV